MAVIFWGKSVEERRCLQLREYSKGGPWEVRDIAVYLNPENTLTPSDKKHRYIQWVFKSERKWHDFSC